MKNWTGFRWAAARDRTLESMGANALLCLGDPYGQQLTWPPSPDEMWKLQREKKLVCLETYRHEGQRWISFGFIAPDEGDGV